MQEMGYPLISVEITENQLTQCINDAIEIYTEYIIQDEEYLAIDLESFSEDGEYTMPTNVTSVYALSSSNAISSSGDGNRLFSLNNMIARPIIADLAFQSNTPAGSTWVDYTLAKQAIEIASDMTGSAFTYEYSPRTRILKLYPNPVSLNMSGYIVICCSTIRADDYQVGERWVKYYALACAKEKVGLIRKKYEGVQLLGGGTVDTSIRDEGREEKQTLMEELKEMNPTHYFTLD